MDICCKTVDLFQMWMHYSRYSHETQLPFVRMSYFGLWLTVLGPACFVFIIQFVALGTYYAEKSFMNGKFL